MADLKLPMLDQRDAFSDALMTAMIYLALRDLKQRDVRIARRHAGALILRRLFVGQATAASHATGAPPVRISTSRPRSSSATSLASRSTSLTRWLTKTIGIENASRIFSM